MRIRFPILCVCFALAASNSSKASVLVQTFDVDPQNASWTNIFNVAKYDSSQGPLVSVTIRLLGNVAGDLGVENLEDKFNLITGSIGANFDGYFPSNPTSVVSLALNNGGSTLRDPFDGNVDFGGDSGYTFGSLASGGTNSIVFLSPADLVQFVGGGTLPFQLSAVHAFSAAAGEGTPVTFDNISSFGQLEVDYEIAVAPEPTDLFLIGLVGLVVSRGQRRLWRAYRRRHARDESEHLLPRGGHEP